MDMRRQRIAGRRKKMNANPTWSNKSEMSGSRQSLGNARSSSSQTPNKGTEVCTAVKNVNALGMLEGPHHQVGSRGRNHFNQYFDQIRRENHPAKHAHRVRPEECNEDDHGCVHSLACNRGTDGAGPKPFAARENLETGQCVTVGELASPVSDEAGNGEARNHAEDTGKGGLVVPSGSGRQGNSELAHGGKQCHGEEAEPYGATRGAVTVNLSKYVTADVGQREKKLGGADLKRPELANLGADKIGNEQDYDKANGQCVQKPVLSGHYKRIAQWEIGKCRP